MDLSDIEEPSSGAEVLRRLRGDNPSPSRLQPFFELWLDTFIFRGTVPATLREAAILRIMWKCGQSYEWANHYRLARQAGMSRSEILAIRSKTPRHDLPPDAATAVEAADDVVNHGALLPDTYDAIRAVLSDPETVEEFLYLLGGYRMFATVSATTGRTAADHGLPVWPPDGQGPEGSNDTN